jgi:hypothetical protein
MPSPIETKIGELVEPTDFANFQTAPTETVITELIAPSGFTILPLSPTPHLSSTTMPALPTSSSSIPAEHPTTIDTGLSQAAITSLCVIFSILGIILILGVTFLCWQRITGTRVARLVPGEEVVGPNEGFLRNMYLSEMWRSRWNSGDLGESSLGSERGERKE